MIQTQVRTRLFPNWVNSDSSDTITEHIELSHASTIKGIGDDAAVINPEGKRVLTSTDMLVEGIHFDLAYVPLKHLGYKAAIVNFSDIYAMQGVPTQLLCFTCCKQSLSGRSCRRNLFRYHAGLQNLRR
jgi:thiamine-monophosphate kinase